MLLQVLAKKMTVLYKLSKEQLSSQHHYDFGLRALKSVLVMAGSLKRSSPDMSEALVLMRALRDMNLPKFVYDDVPLFLGLINDLFPGMPPHHVADIGLDTSPCAQQCRVNALPLAGTQHADGMFSAYICETFQLVSRSTVQRLNVEHDILAELQAWIAHE